MSLGLHHFQQRCLWQKILKKHVMAGGLELDDL